LLPALLAAHDGELRHFDLRWHDSLSCVAVVMAGRGYPGEPVRGGVIKGIQAAAAVPGALVFHGATKADADGTVRADGGRVLTVCATGADVRAARNAAYAAVDRIAWADGFCRRDIGWRALG